MLNGHLAMIASVSQLKSKLTEKGATRSSVLMRKKMPSGSSELQEMPRRHAYEEGAGGDGAEVMRSGARTSMRLRSARPTPLDFRVCALPPAPSVRNAVEPISR